MKAEFRYTGSGSRQWGCDMVQALPAKQESRSVEPARHDIRNLRKVIIKNISGTHRMPILTWKDLNADADFGEN